MNPARLPDTLAFHKMHGAGNDFVVLDWRDQDWSLDAGLAALIADRKRGIGCDQILVIRNPVNPQCSAAYEIRNADGGTAGQCGNGARCIALYLQMTDSPQEKLLLESPAGPVEVRHCADGEFELDMGEPRFEPGQVPVALAPVHQGFAIDSPFGRLDFLAASMGNPHALLQVDDIQGADVDGIGAFLGKHEIFPEGCNIGFVQLIDRENVRLRVFERGAGETLACGSGACAAVAMLHRAGLVDRQVRVFLPGGLLVIKWPGAGRGVMMKGPATHVFSGTMSMRAYRESTL